MREPGLTAEIARLLAKDKDMTNLGPDVTFALQREKHAFNPSEIILDEILELLRIVPGVHHPFLIVEGKSSSGYLDGARTKPAPVAQPSSTQPARSDPY